jgi:hypothetical protein
MQRPPGGESGNVRLPHRASAKLQAKPTNSAQPRILGMPGWRLWADDRGSRWLPLLAASRLGNDDMCSMPVVWLSRTCGAITGQLESDILGVWTILRTWIGASGAPLAPLTANCFLIGEVLNLFPNSLVVLRHMIWISWEVSVLRSTKLQTR